MVSVERAYGWRAAFYVFAPWVFSGASSGIGGSATPPPKRRASPEAEKEQRSDLPASLRLVVACTRRDCCGIRNFHRLLLCITRIARGAYFFIFPGFTPIWARPGSHGESDGSLRLRSVLRRIGGRGGGGYFSDRLTRTHSLRFARCPSARRAYRLRRAAFVRYRDTDKWGRRSPYSPSAWAQWTVDAAGRMVHLCGFRSGRTRGHPGAVETAGQIGSLISSVAFGYWVEWYGSYDRALMRPVAAMLIVSGCVLAAIDPPAGE